MSETQRQMVVSRPLYQIADAFKHVHAMLEDPDTSPDDFADTLEALEGELQLKAENIASLVQHQSAKEAMIAEAIKSLQGRKQAESNKREKLLGYLKHNMGEAGVTKIECPLFTIRIQAGRAIACVDDEDALPVECLRTKTEPDKKAILDRLKAGEEVPGASLGKSADSLIIKV